MFLCFCVAIMFCDVLFAFPQEGEEFYSKCTKMENILKGGHLKLAQAQHDSKKAKYQPDAKFQKDLKGCLDNLDKLAGQLRSTATERICCCF